VAVRSSEGAEQIKLLQAASSESFVPIVTARFMLKAQLSREIGIEKPGEFREAYISVNAEIW